MSEHVTIGLNNKDVPNKAVLRSYSKIWISVVGTQSKQDLDHTPNEPNMAGTMVHAIRPLYETWQAGEEEGNNKRQ